jgi:polysaccharide biosynthesis protein PslG
VRLPLVPTLLGLVLAAATLAQFLAPRLPRSLELPPQQTVQTRNPKVGVHTRLAGVADERYVRDTLAQVREMGASWIVELFPWSYVQPRSRYGFDWNGADMIMGHARQQGLRVIARLDLVPPWARPQRSSDRQLDPERYGDYAAYAAAFARRYAPQGLREIVVWNEPNLRFEWGSPPPDPGAYAALLKVVYPAVKAAAPEVRVLAGALSPGGAIPDARMDDLAFLDGMLDAGAGPFFDGLAAHLYGAQRPPGEPPAPERVNFRRYELYAELLARYRLAPPILVTEGGYNDNPRWSGAVRPSQRLRWTVDTYRWAQGDARLEAVALWQFGTPSAQGTYQDSYSFVAPDGTPKAIYYAVQEYANPGASSSD